MFPQDQVRDTYVPCWGFVMKQILRSQSHTGYHALECQPRFQWQSNKISKWMTTYSSSRFDLPLIPELLAPTLIQLSSIQNPRPSMKYQYVLHTEIIIMPKQDGERSGVHQGLTVSPVECWSRAKYKERNESGLDGSDRGNSILFRCLRQSEGVDNPLSTVGRTRWGIKLRTRLTKYWKNLILGAKH